MPANLPAEAKAKWLRVMEARTPQEKLEALKDFLSSVPKHKGTAKLRAQIRHKIAVLRREIEERKRKRGKRGPKFFIRKSGMAQAVLVGLTNSGKSTLLKYLTNANPSIAERPFETKLPIPGMLQYGDLSIQLVEAPALIEGASKGAMWGLQVLTLAKNADVIILVIDLSYDPLYQLKVIVSELSDAGILLSPKKFEVRVERRRGCGITILGLDPMECKKLGNLLNDLGISDVIVKVSGEASAEDVVNAILGYQHKPALVLATKYDVSRDNFNKLEGACRELRLKAYPFSPQIPRENLKRELCRAIMKALNLILVYVKTPGSTPIPVTLNEGSIVLDLIEKVLGNRILGEVKYVKVWSNRFKFNPQKLGLKSPLGDGDLVEIAI
ncbi:MAG: hypothetical protein B6U69_02515 [Thermofilum sp. ex4484_15]|nr:MAG: hypothetical protein B6U69_02515 [Thermofilum sp. ex4484_15]